MRHLRVHIGPEAVFLRPQLFPEAHRALRRETHAHDALDRLEAILPRQMQAQRCPHRGGQRLAIGARHHEREIVRRLCHGDALDIGPGIAGEQAVLLPRRHLRLVEGLEAQVLGVRCRLRKLHQSLERETRPRHHHRPGLDAAMTVDALLERHLGKQVIDRDGRGFLNFAVDHDRPWANWQRLRRVGDALG